MRRRSGWLPTKERAGRPLSFAALVNAVLHLAGLVLAQVAIRPGSPLVAVADRIDYVAGRPLAWTVAWLVWGLCAFALLVFLALASRRRGEASVLGSLALALGAAGVGVDLLCDTLYVTVLPAVAAEGQASLFLVAERALGAGGVVVANGLYSVAVLLVTFDRRPGLSRGGASLGYVTFASGLLMAAGGLAGEIRVVAFATGPTILSFVAWALVVAWDLERPRHGP